jgi:DnaK suppressor protein
MDQKTLDQFHRRLQELRARVDNDFEGLRAAIQNETGHPGEPSHTPTHPADADVEGLEVDLIMSRTEGEILAAIEDALVRFTEGTFGKCVECGKPIPVARLRAIPYARRCIGCASE